VQHSSFDVTSSATVAGRFAGTVAPGLWQRDARRTAGLPGNQLDRLQSVINAAAQLVCSARKYEHITLLLCDLQWLQVLEWIEFKLSVLVFRCLHGTALL